MKRTLLQWTKRVIFNAFTAKLFLPTSLRLHTFAYHLSSRFASAANHGEHPKHRIIGYKEWFLSQIRSKDTVLDVGCNTGKLSITLSAKASFVYGIEISPVHIAEAKAKNSRDNIQYLLADATTFDYSSCTPIDVVTLSNVLEHIEDREAFLASLNSRVTWRDPYAKRMLIRVPLLEREWPTILKREMGLEYRLDRTHWTEYTIDGLETELKSAGFEITFSFVRFGELYASAIGQPFT